MIPNTITPENQSLFVALFPQEATNIQVGKVIWIGHYDCRFTAINQKLPKHNKPMYK